MQSNVCTLTDDFLAVMAKRFSPFLTGQKKIAVAVSGGADSMALASLLCAWAREQAQMQVHVLSVDHALREGSRAEAEAVGAFFKNVSCTTHKILTWAHDGIPSSKLQEQAREARYALLAAEMREQGIAHLFVAHHQNDQAETVLFRLAKGSGLDGLAGMSDVQDFADGLKICRPLLGFPKDELVSYCQKNAIPYVDDPSNYQERFARIRLRNAMEILEREGLSAKRLARMSGRMARAREALEQTTEEAFRQATLQIEASRIVFDFNLLKSMPEEILLRIILKSVSDLGEVQKYGVRMEKAESLCGDLMNNSSFRKRTLGGVVFERKDGQGLLVLTREQEKRKN